METKKHHNYLYFQNDRKRITNAVWGGQVHVVSPNSSHPACGSGTPSVMHKRRTTYRLTHEPISCKKCQMLHHSQGDTLPIPAVIGHRPRHDPQNYERKVMIFATTWGIKISFYPKTLEYIAMLHRSGRKPVTIKGEGLHLSDIRLKLLQIVNDEERLMKKPIQAEIIYPQDMFWQDMDPQEHDVDFTEQEFEIALYHELLHYGIDADIKGRNIPSLKIECEQDIYQTVKAAMDAVEVVYRQNADE